MLFNVFLFDDKAIKHGYGRGGRDGDRVETWLITTNAALLDHLIALMPAKSYNILANGGVQQDQMSDIAYMRTGGSFVPVLPILQSCLSNTLPSQVVFDPFWMADIYGQHEAGSSFQTRLRELYADSQNEEHVSWVFDASQITTVYAHAHRTLCLNPQLDQAIIRYYHSASEVLEQIADFYQQAAGLLPNKLKLELYYYNGKTAPKLEHTILGTGAVDKHYAWSIRFLAAKFGQWDDLATTADEINSAEGLQDFYLKNPLPDSVMIDSKLAKQTSLVSLLQVLRTQFNQLATNNSLGNKPNYLRAQHVDHLPEKYSQIEGIKRSVQALPSSIGSQSSQQHGLKKQDQADLLKPDEGDTAEHIERSPQNRVYSAPARPRAYSSRDSNSDVEQNTGLLGTLGSFFGFNFASSAAPSSKRPQIVLKDNSVTKPTVSAMQEMSNHEKFNFIEAKLKGYIKFIQKYPEHVNYHTHITDIYNEVHEAKSYGIVTDKQADRLVACFINLACIVAQIYYKQLAVDTNATALTSLQDLMKLFIHERQDVRIGLFFDADQELDYRYAVVEYLCDYCMTETWADNYRELQTLQQLFNELELPAEYTEKLGTQLANLQRLVPNK